ncbi:MAG: hypothetical protein KF861_08650 [Planctomycetaceae bacterium]|nr:hypothetical protein [Planctomycetaceae bacterium]
MQDLGTLGGISSRAHAISPDGLTVVGQAALSVSNTHHAFRWSDSSGMEDLGTLGGSYSAADAISADGMTVVGWARPSDSSENHAVRWSVSDGIQDLHLIADRPRISVGRFVSADGMTVAINARYEGHHAIGLAYRWNSSVGMQALGTLDGDYSVTSGMSFDGAAVAGTAGCMYWLASDQDQSAGLATGSRQAGACQPWGTYYSRAFRWTSTNGIQDLGTLNGTGSAATAMSADGEVVAGIDWVSDGSYYLAFRWTTSSGMQGIGSLGTACSPWCIGADGSSIAGSSSMISGPDHAFLWTAANGIQDLNVLLPSLGIDLTGWVLTEVVTMTPDGVTLCGNGTHNGNPEAWIANLSLGRVVDFNNIYFRDTQQPLVERLWEGGDERKGLVADGVTKLLIRTPIYHAPGQVRFEVFAPDDVAPPRPTESATLSDPFSENQNLPPANVLTVDLQQMPGTNDFRGFAIVTAPLDFVRAIKPEDRFLGHSKPRELRVTFSVEYEGMPEWPSPRTFSLELHRPPVVLIHGMEGFPQDFQWSMIHDPLYTIELADWHTTHDKPMITNLGVTGKFINSALARLRNEGIAATQADVFGHSTGGILARLYTLNQFDYGDVVVPTFYLRDDNFQRGDIHKLITVNTPHWGSQIADSLLTPDNLLTPAGKIAACFTDGPNTDDPETDGRCTSCGLVFDFQTDSRALSAMNAHVSPVTLPVHTIVGIGGRDNLFLSESPPEIAKSLPAFLIAWYVAFGTIPDYYLIRTWASTASCLQPVSQFFGGPNDLVSSAVSQRGGLVGSHVKEFGGDGSWHFPIVHENPSGEVNLWARHLLDASADTASGASLFRNQFPTQTLPALSNTGCTEPVMDLFGSNVSFVFPFEGMVSQPGAAVNVDIVQKNPNLLQTGMTLEAPSIGVSMPLPVPDIEVVGSDIVAHWNATLNVPSWFIGPLVIRALPSPSPSFATRAAGSCPTTRLIYVLPKATLVELVATGPDSSGFSLNKSHDIGVTNVQGVFDDGLTGDVHHPSLGTTYSILNGVALKGSSSTPATTEVSVASVSADGVVKGLHVGTATLVVTNGGLTCSVPIEVTSAKGDFNDDGQVDALDRSALLAAFSGPWVAPGYYPPQPQSRDSFDFDNDGDIDSDDWTQFVSRWTGLNNPGGSVEAARTTPPGSRATLIAARVANRIDMINDPANASITIEDATGALTVFGSNAMVQNILNATASGNLLDRLTGTVSVYNGLFELINVTTVTPSGASAATPELRVTAADFADGSSTAEALESRFVRVDNYVFDQPGSFAIANYENGGISVRVSTTAIAAGLNNTLGHIPTGDLVRLHGVFAQFDTTAPFDAGYQIYVTSIERMCPGDIDGNQMVDDADFSIFVVAYDILDCLDPAMTAECPADLNGDGLVEDADFSIFVVAYNALLCP